MLSTYLVESWNAGDGLTWSELTLAGIQHSAPQHVGKVPGCGRLLRTWRKNELPNREPLCAPLIFRGMTCACAGCWGFAELRALKSQDLCSVAAVCYCQCGTHKKRPATRCVKSSCCHRSNVDPLSKVFLSKSELSRVCLLIHTVGLPDVLKNTS